MPTDTHERTPATEIVAAGAQTLAVRSSALALRGLRDLARQSNWLAKRLFVGRASGLRISADGAVAVALQTAAGLDRALAYEIEEAAATELRAEPAAAPSEPRAVFAWAPARQLLAGAWSRWTPQLHFFDLRGRVAEAGFAPFEHFPAFLAWSRDAKFLAEARSGGRNAGVRLWQAAEGALPYSGAPAGELGFPGWIERQTYEAEFGEDGAFLGYGRLAFSPDGRALACAAEFQGEWADDSIAIVELPGMTEQLTHPAQGHITDITWTPDGRQLIYCAAGQAYRLDIETMEPEVLPFGAEWCACHPELPFCVGFSGWLKNAAKGRLFLADLRNMRVFDEHAAEGVADLSWNADGTKAYAVTRDGMAYVYEPAFL